MLSKNEVKDIQSLRHKKFRDESKLFVAEGPKIVTELTQLVPGHVQVVYGTGDWIEQNRKELENVPVREVSQIELAKISQLQTPNAVVAILKQFETSLPVNLSTFCIYLDAIQDPGNFGTIIRIADWFGIRQVVCTEGCADLYNSKVVQSTMASIARVQVAYDPDLNWIKAQNVPVYAALLNGKSLYDFPKTEAGILMIGNESKGLRAELQHVATEQVTIPRRGEAESLNAAVATGIILSHLLG